MFIKTLQIIWHRVVNLVIVISMCSVAWASGDEEVTERTVRIQALSWSADGKELIFSSNRGYEDVEEKIFYLWRIETSGKGLAQITFPLKDKQGNIVHFNDNNPQSSPKGDWIALDSNRGETRQDNPKKKLTQVFLCDAQGKEFRQITKGQGWINNWQPSWNPKGKTLAWVTDRNSGADIMLGDTEGKELRYLRVDSKLREYYPSWSSTGDSLIFMAKRQWSREASPSYLCVQNISEKGASPISKLNAVLIHPDEFGLLGSSSPTEGSLAFIKRDGTGINLWISKIDGSEPKCLTNVIKNQLSLSYFVRPAWEPKGNKIAFVAVSKRTKLPDLYEEGIWIYDLVNSSISEVPIPPIRSTGK